MKWQYADVAKELAESDGGKPHDTVFLGGTDKADLWLCSNGVMVCQYGRDTDEYVSYLPADAVWIHAQGKLESQDASDLPESCNAPVVWYGSGYAIEQHDPELIAAYLFCFVPHVFSTETLKEIYNSKGEDHGT